MAIIDAHHHLWRLAHHPYSFAPGFAPIAKRDFTPEDLMPELKRAGIDGTILVQTLNNFDETLEYFDLADRYAFIRGVVGWVQLADPKVCVQQLDRLQDRGKFAGIRHLMAYEPDPDWVLQRGVIDSLRMLAERGLVFEALAVNEKQNDAVLRMIDRLPDLKVNLNHLGHPQVIEQAWEPWASQMTRAAASPNVSVKLSAGGALVLKWRWSTDALRRYADHLIAVFGANRIVAASNWPVVLLAGSFAEAWNGINDLIAGCSPAERAAILGGAAEAIYRL